MRSHQKIVPKYELFFFDSTRELLRFRGVEFFFRVVHHHSNTSEQKNKKITPMSDAPFSIFRAFQPSFFPTRKSLEKKVTGHGKNSAEGTDVSVLVQNTENVVDQIQFYTLDLIRMNLLRYKYRRVVQHDLLSGLATDLELVCTRTTLSSAHFTEESLQ